MEQLEATVLGTVFRNNENGYSVLAVSDGTEEHTVVGTMPALGESERVVFNGEWKNHPAYGRQFHCVELQILPLTDLESLRRYLASGIIQGIGPTLARNIVSVFGEETLSVLSEHPEMLAQVPGIGPRNIRPILESLQETQEKRRVMIALQKYGLSLSLMDKIISVFHEKSLDIIRNNPYLLCDSIEGIGFKTADQIGLMSGIAPDSEIRIRAALQYVLQSSAAERGHVFLPENELCRTTAELLNVSLSLCSAALNGLLVAHRLVAECDENGNRRIFLPAYLRAEEEIALRIQQLMVAANPSPFPKAAKAITSFEKRSQITFSPTQRDAIRGALESGVFVITGGPGTGKSTIINCILHLFSGKKINVTLCAPTGRAAKRMTEVTGQDAKTIHRLLECSGKQGLFQRNENEPLEADCVIVDEASMIDLLLMRSLLRALVPGTRLILVGDADQLPSVGAGNVLGDILSSGIVPCVRLKDIYRQSETSHIVLNAHRINRGEMPVLNSRNTDFFFERKDPHGAAESVISLTTSRLPGYLGYPARNAVSLAVENIQVLSPTKKGECGVHNLNRLLQAALNPPSDNKPELIREQQEEKTVFRLGDKVIQTKNNYGREWVRNGVERTVNEGVFNGDIGMITQVSPEKEFLTVLFDDGREVQYEQSDLSELDIAYCLTVHKSQGSEFPVVVMPVVDGPPLLLTRNLLYTAVTRARTLVVLIGSEDTIRRMVDNNRIISRNTTLADRLKNAAEMIS